MILHHRAGKMLYTQDTKPDLGRLSPKREGNVRGNRERDSLDACCFCKFGLFYGGADVKVAISVVKRFYFGDRR